MEWKGYELSIHDHDIDFCVTMVGWVDVPDSDQGDSDIGTPSTYLAHLDHKWIKQKLVA